jgi:hypothetical protein
MSADFHFDHVTDRPVSVAIGDQLVTVTLADGRKIGNPLDWHPWLRDANPEAQALFELQAFSVYWPDLDEGLDIEGMLRGIRPVHSGNQVEAVTA